MNKIRILIVEDGFLAIELEKSVTTLGHIVTGVTTDYRSALHSFKKEKPDLVLMDIELGEGKDGIELAKTIQTIDSVLIIYITSHQEEEFLQRAAATDYIAYLQKPIRNEDLKLNLQLALYILQNRQTIPDQLQELSHGYAYHTQTCNLFHNGTLIKLSKNEKILLKYLMEARGNPISFENLEELIWEGKPVSENSLRTLVYRLNTKLNKHKLIECIPSLGYCLSIESR